MMTCKAFVLAFLGLGLGLVAGSAKLKGCTGMGRRFCDGNAVITDECPEICKPDVSMHAYMLVALEVSRMVLLLFLLGVVRECHNVVRFSRQPYADRLPARNILHNSRGLHREVTRLLNLSAVDASFPPKAALCLIHLWCVPISLSFVFVSIPFRYCAELPAQPGRENTTERSVQVQGLGLGRPCQVR